MPENSCSSVADTPFYQQRTVGAAGLEVGRDCLQEMARGDLRARREELRPDARLGQGQIGNALDGLWSQLEDHGAKRAGPVLDHGRPRLEDHDVVLGEMIALPGPQEVLALRGQREREMDALLDYGRRPMATEHQVAEPDTGPAEPRTGLEHCLDLAIEFERATELTPLNPHSRFHGACETLVLQPAQWIVPYRSVRTSQLCRRIFRQQAKETSAMWCVISKKIDLSLSNTSQPRMQRYDTQRTDANRAACLELH